MKHLLNFVIAFLLVFSISSPVYAIDNINEPINQIVQEEKKNDDFEFYKEKGTLELKSINNNSISLSATEYYEIEGSIGGKVKGIIEAKIGGKINSSKTATCSFDVSIPENYYRKIEVWQYLTKYKYNVTKNNNHYGNDACYKPNGGKRIVNDLYEK